MTAASGQEVAAPLALTPFVIILFLLSAAFLLWRPFFHRRLQRGEYDRIALPSLESVLPLHGGSCSGGLSLQQRVRAFHLLPKGTIMYKVNNMGLLNTIVYTINPDHVSTPCAAPQHHGLHRHHPHLAQQLLLGRESVLLQAGERATRDRVRLSFVLERLEEDLFPMMRAAGCALRDRLLLELPGGAVGFLPEAEFGKTAFEVITHACFGSAAAGDMQQYRGSFLLLMRMAKHVAAAAVSIPGTEWAFAKAQQWMLRGFNARVVELQQQAEDNHAPRYDLLRMMMALPSDEEEEEEDATIEGVPKALWVRHNLVTLMWLGAEPVACALHFCALLLATHPHYQDRVHGELAAIVGGTNNLQVKEELTLAVLDRLLFTEAVIKESLRLFPPTLGFSCALGGDHVADVDGVPMPPGVDIRIDVLNMHRREDLFSNPNEFLPERWLTGSSETASEQAFMPFATMPSGRGGGSCGLGSRFAMMEIKTVLVTLLMTGKSFRPWEPMPPIPDATTCSSSGVLRTLTPLRLMFV